MVLMVCAIVVVGFPAPAQAPERKPLWTQWKRPHWQLSPRHLNLFRGHILQGPSLRLLTSRPLSQTPLSLCFTPLAFSYPELRVQLTQRSMTQTPSHSYTIASVEMFTRDGPRGGGERGERGGGEEERRRDGRMRGEEEKRPLAFLYPELRINLQSYRIMTVLSSMCGNDWEKQKVLLSSLSGEVISHQPQRMVAGQQVLCQGPDGETKPGSFLSCVARFINETEQNMGPPGQAKQCQLRTFLTYYINDLFLHQVRTEINKEIQAVPPPPVPPECNDATITVSTVVVEKSIQDLMTLMQDLSAYSNQFLEMVCDKLKEYKEICNTAYRGIAPVVMEKLTIVIVGGFCQGVRGAKRGDKLIPQNEILRDVRGPEGPANLQESMEGGLQLKGFFINLPTSQ
ncbi:unnamed protein product [Coregonus sp. 'balchen']|nr:unnamed protein product [Coregonus sp. 'balchen']